jgi:hypothetical protein
MARRGADWKSLQLGEATGVRSRQIAEEHLYRGTPLGAIAQMIRANRMQRKWNATIARDEFSLEDFANPYSFFIV